ncbi:5-formyltetrahydrofolate cyclo-ligase [Arthrobacter sp. SA17]
MSVKELLRSRHRMARAAMTEDDRNQAGKDLAIHGLTWANQKVSEQLASGISRTAGSATFAVYLGVGTEPPTLPLIHALHAAGNRILLPVCQPERRLSWVYWTPGSAFTRSKYAPIQEPVGEQHDLSVVGSAAGMFLPATAVDRSGNRIGQGGGYYDRLLADLVAEGWNVPGIAVVYDSEVLAEGSIPAEAFDQPVRSILTPSEIIQL